MNSKKDRMSEIAFWAIPPEGTDERTRVNKYLESEKDNPEIPKKIKKIFDKATALIAVQQVNGLGFLADKMLREYNLEYNNRVLNGSLHDLPGSFNVAEAFNKFLPPSSTFKLRDEIDHIFSFDNFIDYITSASFDSSTTPTLENIIEGKIYSYNSTSNPEDLIFSTNNGNKYGFSSVSFVRFGHEVSIILVAGQECDLDKKTNEILEQIQKQKIYSHRTHISPSDEYTVGAMPLTEESNLFKNIVLTRIDINKQTFDVRYVYEDWGQSYHGITDDLSSYIDHNGVFLEEKAEELYKKMPERLNDYQALFELCKTCLFLPNYFEHYEENIILQRHPTEYIQFRKKLKNKKIVSLAHSSQKKTYRQPYSLNLKKRTSPDRGEFVTPEIQIENSGFWKQLPIQSKGQDKNGHAINGRTWVNKTLSWVESSTGASSLSLNRKQPANKHQNGGYIYVMRSAAHKKDIFKIGLTKRSPEVRSRELSYSTSSPDHFLVVEEWYVNDCILAEKLIHDKLKDYRVNPKREYFKVHPTKAYFVS